MIFLVDTEETAPGGLRARFHRLLTGGEPFRIEDTVVLGVRMRRLTIEMVPGQSAGATARSIARAAVKMRLEHAGKVIFAAEFRYKELFLREGFVESDASALTAALAGRLAGRAASDSGTAALFAKAMSDRACGTLLELCRAFRCVMTATDSPGNPIFEELRRRTGISVVVGPTAGQLRHVDAAVFFDPPHREIRLPPSCVAVEAAPGAVRGISGPKIVSRVSLGLTGKKAPGLIPGYPAEKLLAAALDAGTLTPGEIQLREVAVAENGGAPIGPLDKNTSIYYNECSYTTDN